VLTLGVLGELLVLGLCEMLIYPFLQSYCDPIAYDLQIVYKRMYALSFVASSHLLPVIGARLARPFIPQ
jgi:hypothetical protein